MKPLEFSCALQEGTKAGIACNPSIQDVRLTEASNVLLPRNETTAPIDLNASLVAAALVLLKTQAYVVSHEAQERPLAITSMEDEAVRAGLLIAMMLAASGPTYGIIDQTEAVDNSIAISNAIDPAEVGAKVPKARRNSNKKKVTAEPVPLEKLKYLTFAQTDLRYQVHTEKALRHLQAQAEAYLRYPKAGLRSNGFIECIFRPNGQRKLFIIAANYEQWLVSYSNRQLGALVSSVKSDLASREPRTIKTNSASNAGAEASQ